MDREPSSGFSAARVDLALFIVTAFLLAALMALLGWSLQAQLGNYRSAIDRELKQAAIDHAVILSYSRAWDFAVVKTGGLFLGFVQVLLGAIYLLKTATTTYTLAAENERIGKFALATSSPGLVMMSLGVATIVFVLYSKSDVMYTAPTQRNPDAPKTEHVVVTPAD